MERQELMERWKATAGLFLRDDVKVFIKTISNDLYFCDIVLVGEDTITVQCFGPQQRNGMKFVLYWNLIEEFEEYQGVRP